MAVALADVKDVVLATLGKRDLEPAILGYIVESGRRLVEKDNNWYWMRKLVTFNLTINDGEYTVAAAGDVTEGNFKQSRKLLVKDPNLTHWDEVIPGDQNQIDLMYATDSTGFPERYIVDDASDGTLTLRFYPVDPDKAYNIRWYIYVWTSNPSSDTGTDELITRWPEILVNASIAQGYRIVHKSEELAQPWEGMMMAEMAKLKRFDWFRMESERNDLVPRRGPFLGRAERSIENLKIYI
jgi:hypothetical protein